MPSLPFPSFLLLALVTARFQGLGQREIAGRAFVGDGDSLELNGVRVRLIGIDAPEYGQTCVRDGQEYHCGHAARNFLKKLISGRPVVCKGRDNDRFGRFLAVCRAGETVLNPAMVHAGWAVGFGGYGTEENEARGAGRGLWAGDFQLPRDWRDAKGGSAETEHRTGRSIFRFLRESFEGDPQS